MERQNAEGDVSNYQANGEFDLINFSAVKHIQHYSCCPEPYPDITYTIVLKRRPMFYVFNLILPCILINCIGKVIRIVLCKSIIKTFQCFLISSITGFLCSIRIWGKSYTWNKCRSINDCVFNDYSRNFTTNRKDTSNK